MDAVSVVGKEIRWSMGDDARNVEVNGSFILGKKQPTLKNLILTKKGENDGCNSY
jgi:hypothetical protein